ncbi:hypothetical protein [Mycobacterium sp.]|uniref:hypothetical protein n=1 Tax=Mycobacterium sp. TaxID=1785 RepID=UPI0025CBA1FF|nr:hypothetical protein [Mycobacterium sp.]
MTKRGFNDDGTIDDLPWASVFDPAANARALSAIQAEGFRAASRIVDRFVRAVEPKVDGGAADATGEGTTVGDSLNEFERLTRAWWSMTGQFLLRSLPATAKSGSDSVSLDTSDPGAGGGVNVDVAVGESAQCEIWLHNRGTDDQGDVRLHVSDLLSHDGNVIPSTAVRTDTQVVPMPARSSRGVGIVIAAGPEVRPGIYRGTILASGNPDLWLPVTLTVRLPNT